MKRETEDLKVRISKEVDFLTKKIQESAQGIEDNITAS